MSTITEEDFQRYVKNMYTRAPIVEIQQKVENFAIQSKSTQEIQQILQAAWEKLSPAGMLSTSDDEKQEPESEELVSDEEREIQIRSNNEDTEELWDDEKFLLRLLDEARAEIARLKTATAEPAARPVLYGPFWNSVLSDHD